MCRCRRGKGAFGRVEATAMARDQENQQAKDRIKEGMSEAGKDAGKKRPEDDKTAGSGGSDKITEGMSEAGKDPTDPLEDQAGGAPS